MAAEQGLLTIGSRSQVNAVPAPSLPHAAHGMHRLGQVGFGALDGTSFTSACSTLADHGLLGLGPAREERLRRVTLRAAAADVTLALQGVRLLSRILGVA